MSLLKWCRRAFFDEDSERFMRVQAFVSALIVVSCVLLALEASLEPTDPRHAVLFAIDRVLLGLFALEYGLRLWAVPVQVPRSYPVTRWEWLFYQVTNRFLFCLTPMSLLDLAAIVSLVPALRTLRVLRIFRLIRLTKTFHYAKPLYTLVYVLRSNGLMFMYTLTFFAIAIVTGGGSLYLAESRTNPNLNGLADAFYWAVVTITTVGYGDISPQTPAGRFVSILLMVAGLGVLAMMTGVVSQTLVGHIFSLRKETVRMSLISNHVLVCGWHADAPLVIEQLSRQYQDERVQIVVFAPCERPADLVEHVHFIQGNPTKEAEWSRARRMRRRSSRCSRCARMSDVTSGLIRCGSAPRCAIQTIRRTRGRRARMR